MSVSTPSIDTWHVSSCRMSVATPSIDTRHVSPCRMSVSTPSIDTFLKIERSRDLSSFVWLSQLLGLTHDMSHQILQLISHKPHHLVVRVSVSTPSIDVWHDWSQKLSHSGAFLRKALYVCTMQGSRAHSYRALQRFPNSHLVTQEPPNGSVEETDVCLYTRALEHFPVGL